MSQNPLAAVDRENPWPGLASFTEDARSFFFGREKETEELVRLIRRNTLTVLFGQSGLGKSSLLQAGAFPQLRDADFLPLYLRLDHSSPIGNRQSAIGNSLADQVKAALVDAFKSVGADAPAPRADETLWEYFHRKDVDIWSAKNRLLTPVLAFDQFEEIFTLGRASEAQRERGRAFLTELADLVENRAPAELRAKFDAGELDIARYNFDKPSCQVVLSLREDFLPDLEGLKHEMRSILHSRMRVKRLNGTQALEIVTRPAPQLIAEDVAVRIVEFVAGARGGSAERLNELEVEPALLSVICRELNERRRTLGQAQITADLVSGNRREILTDFYERSVADLPAEMRTFVEDHLLTKSGFRDNLALETALEFPGVTRPLIDTLVSRRLLRIEDRLGVQRVELTHDVLAEVIRGSRDERQQRFAVQQLHERERITRRRMWLARIIAAGLLVFGTGVSWIAWRAVRAEREQTRLRADAEKLRSAADAARERADVLRVKAETDELAALRKAYASDMNALQAALSIDNLGRARTLLNRHRPKPGEPDLRGWEWRYLWQFCQSDAQSVLIESGAHQIKSVALSADGKWAAVGADFGSGQLSVHNLQTKETIRVPAGDGSVRVAFSPRESLLAFATVETRPLAARLEARVAGALPPNRVLLWDVNTRRVVRELSIAGTANGLSFSEDGQTLVIGSGTNAGGEVSVWRVADGSKVAGWAVGLGANRTGLSLFAATRDATVAAVATGLNKLSVIDLKTGRERWSAVGADDRVHCFAFSPDGRVLASGAGYVDTAIRLWDAATGRPLGRLEGQRGWTSGLAFLADGKHLVSGSADQILRLWDLETHTVVRAFRGHNLEVHALALAEDQRTLLSGGKDGSAYLWDLTSDRDSTSSGTFARGRGGWVFSANGDAIVTLETDGRVARRHGRMFEEETPLLEVGRIAIALGSRGTIRAVMDPKRPLLGIVTEAEKVQVWDWERRMLVRDWDKPADTSFVVPLGFSADGTKLLLFAPSAGGGSIREWDLASSRETRSIKFPSPENRRVALVSPDGTHVALLSAGNEESVRVDLTSGRFSLHELKLSQANNASTISPDGKSLVVASSMGYAKIFDAATYRETTTLSGFMFGVHGAGYSPDQQRLALSSTAFEALTLWDVHNYERLLTLPSVDSSLGTLRFSPDGNVLAGGGGDTIRFWRAPSWAEIEKAEADSVTKARPR